MSEPNKAAADAALELELAGDRQVEEKHAEAAAIYRVGEQMLLALDRLEQSNGRPEEDDYCSKCGLLYANEHEKVCDP